MVKLEIQFRGLLCKVQLGTMSKLHVYVDETGKDARSANFVVCILIMEQGEIENAKQILEEVETESRKHQLKWAKTQMRRNKAYIEGVIASGSLRGVGFSRIDAELESELQQISAAIASAVIAANRADTKIHVHIDGELSPRLEQQYKNSLKKWGLKVSKVKGVRKTSPDAILCRYVDACCGLVRSATEGGDMRLLDRAVAIGLLQFLK